MKKVDTVLDLVFDQRPPRIPFDQGYRGTAQLIRQQQGRFIVSEVGDRDLARLAFVVARFDSFIDNPRSAVLP
jgi:hypothetical protein